MSGKKTLANIFKLKYGLHIIDPKHIIKEAILLAFPPVEDDDKKKKAVVKKDAKIEEKKENPELKELGEKLNEFES